MDKVLAHEHDLYITFARRFIWRDGVLANGGCNSLTSPSLLRNEAVVTNPSHVRVNCIFEIGKDFGHTGRTTCNLVVFVMKSVNVDVFPWQTPWLSPNWGLLGSCRMLGTQQLQLHGQQSRKRQHQPLEDGE